MGTSARLEINSDASVATEPWMGAFETLPYHDAFLVDGPEDVGYN